MGAISYSIGIIQKILKGFFSKSENKGQARFKSLVEILQIRRFEYAYPVISNTEVSINNLLNDQESLKYVDWPSII